MKDPHPILEDRYSDIDLTQRVPRTEDWDEDSLSDYPTDDIMPVCLSDNSDTDYDFPVNGVSVCKVYSRWIYEICKSTTNTGREYAFRTDGYGNIYGIQEGEVIGDEGNIVNMRDYLTHNTLFVHTHPLRIEDESKIAPKIPPGGFSQGDLDLLKESPPYSYMCAVLCPNELIKTRILILGIFDNEEQRERAMGHLPHDLESLMTRYVTAQVDNQFYHAENVDEALYDHEDIMYQSNYTTSLLERFAQQNTVGLDVVPIKFEDGYAVPDRNLNIVPETDPVN
jgi:hypothetical protein